jgi:hypothetical protein
MVGEEMRAVQFNREHSLQRSRPEGQSTIGVNTMNVTAPFCLPGSIRHMGGAPFEQFINRLLG